MGDADFLRHLVESMILPIKEIFLSVQGEGANTGMPAIFVRVGKCNKACGFCDTDFKTESTMDVRSIVDAVLTVGLGCRNVIFTGGEPLLFQMELVQVMLGLMEQDQPQAHRWFFCVETNGSLAMELRFHAYIDWVTVSPKVDPKHLKIRQASELKVVFTTDSARLLEEYRKAVEADFYYLSPMAPPLRLADTMSEYPKHSNYLAVLEYLKEDPTWRLSIQSHKVLRIQ